MTAQARSTQVVVSTGGSHLGLPDDSRAFKSIQIPYALYMILRQRVLYGAAVAVSLRGAIATEVAASASTGAAEMGGGPAQPDVSSWFADPEGGWANTGMLQGREHIFLNVFLELLVQAVPLP